MYEKYQNIDTITMYKMIQALFEYDYYSTKCLVNEFIMRRTEEYEVENLKKIRSLIFHQKDKELRDFLKTIIKEQEKKSKSKKWIDSKERNDRNRID